MRATKATTSIRPLAWLVGGAAVVAAVIAAAVPPGTDDEIRARLEPYGKVARAGDGASAPMAASGPMTGDQVYGQFCFACHAAGVGGAPTYGDTAAWAPRLEKGTDALVASTVNGLGLMPPMGTCMACSEDDIRAAVSYMLDAAR